jgi:asparagine synthase (glutamine-hydrolysing)
MGGIVALFSSRDPISEAVLQRATQSLYHRGPDGQRHWMSPDRRIALGHARLSIMAYSAGKIIPPSIRQFGEDRVVSMLD